MYYRASDARRTRHFENRTKETIRVSLPHFHDRGLDLAARCYGHTLRLRVPEGPALQRLGPLTWPLRNQPDMA
jgi:hypothetical protein